MRIEITDRTMWLEKVASARANVEAARAKDDREYEAHWRKRWFLPNRPETAMPVPDWTVGYPSYIGWSAFDAFKIVELALRSEGTGTVSLNASELKAIEKWATK